MKKIVYLIGLVTVVACSSEPAASNGNSGPLPGNSDKKIYMSHGDGEEHHEEVAHEHAHGDNKHHHEGDQVLFHYDSSKTNLTFTAYKFPGDKKKGVNGTFKTINVKGATESKVAEEVLSNTTFSIPVSSLSTNDISRDGKLQDFFFKNLTNTSEIIGGFGEFGEGKVPVMLVLNDKKVTKDFKYEIHDGQMILIGQVDIIKDFGGSKALEAINEACKELHEGKTWSDVDLKAVIEL